MHGHMNVKSDRQTYLGSFLLDPEDVTVEVLELPVKEQGPLDLVSDYGA